MRISDLSGSKKNLALRTSRKDPQHGDNDFRRCFRFVVTPPCGSHNKRKRMEEAELGGFVGVRDLRGVRSSIAAGLGTGSWMRMSIDLCHLFFACSPHFPFCK